MSMTVKKLLRSATETFFYKKVNDFSGGLLYQRSGNYYADNGQTVYGLKIINQIDSKYSIVNDGEEGKV